eukprot:Sspe_Gene.58373::Locus_32007_Transcript_1_1_Confidence_1.000_Length_1045::g.58373::m.58373
MKDAGVSVERELSIEVARREAAESLVAFLRDKVATLEAAHARELRAARESAEAAQKRVEEAEAERDRAYIRIEQLEGMVEELEQQYRFTKSLLETASSVESSDGISDEEVHDRDRQDCRTQVRPPFAIPSVSSSPSADCSPSYPPCRSPWPSCGPYQHQPEAVPLRRPTAITQPLRTPCAPPPTPYTEPSLPPLAAGDRVTVAEGLGTVVEEYKGTDSRFSTTRQCWWIRLDKDGSEKLRAVDEITRLDSRDLCDFSSGSSASVRTIVIP